MVQKFKCIHGKYTTCQEICEKTKGKILQTAINYNRLDSRYCRPKKKKKKNDKIVENFQLFLVKRELN